MISEPDDDDDDQNNCNDWVRGMLHDLGSAMNIENITGAKEINYTTGTNTNSVNEKEDKFSKLFFIVEQELYPGCENFSKLSFIVQLLNIKCLFGLSGKAIDALLSLLAKAFPQGNKVHVSYYEARKFIRELGLDYVKIDACLNDCILYRGDYL